MHNLGSSAVKVLVVNAGSSSLKLRVLDGDDAVLADQRLPAEGPSGMRAVLAGFLSGAPEVRAAGHRVVHGGSEFREAVRLGREVEARLDQLSDLAPLHNRPAVAAIRALQGLRPDLEQVACFDTAFHSHLPLEASTYALPRELSARYGLRRFGFHGLSHAWASARMAWLMERPLAELRVVTAHLGAGASLAAVAAGQSVDTTMGFTPLEGLVMATRSGSVDPGLIVWLQRHAGLGVDALEHMLENESGLLGVSGVSGDLRAVMEAADGGRQAAALAYDVYLHRLRAGIAAMVAAMAGVDALVFTGGAGEGSARLRRDTCQSLAFLDISVDDSRNAGAGDRLISPRHSRVGVGVVEAREDVEIARQVRAVLAV